MNIQEAGELVESFLRDELLEDPYFEQTEDGEEVPKLSLQHVDTRPDAIDILFMVENEGDENEPDVKALAERALNALKAKHPEVFKYKITHKIWPPP